MSSSLYQRLEIRDVFSPNLQVRSILDRSDPKKSKNKMAISILLKNVTTFYTNIFWYLQPVRSFFLQKDTQTDRRKLHRRRRSNSSLDVLSFRTFRVDNYCLPTLLGLERYEIFLIARSIQDKNGRVNTTYQSVKFCYTCLLDISFKVSKMVFEKKNEWNW